MVKIFPLTFSSNSWFVLINSCFSSTHFESWKEEEDWKYICFVKQDKWVTTIIRFQAPFCIQVQTGHTLKNKAMINISRMYSILCYSENKSSFLSCGSVVFPASMNFEILTCSNCRSPQLYTLCHYKNTHLLSWTQNYCFPLQRFGNFLAKLSHFKYCNTNPKGERDENVYITPNDQKEASAI